MLPDRLPRSDNFSESYLHTIPSCKNAMQNESSIDNLAELADLAAKAEEYLSILDNNSDTPTADLPEEGCIVYTPGNYVEIAITKTQRAKCSLEFIEFNPSQILLSVLLYPDNEYASPVPRTIEKSSIVGWYGDSDTIHLVLPSTHEMITIGKKQDCAVPHANKMVEIIEGLRVNDIKFIAEEDRPGGYLVASTAQSNIQEPVKASDRSQNLVTSSQGTLLYQNIQAGAPAKLWSKLPMKYLKGVVLLLFFVSIIQAIRGDGWGLAVSTLVTAIIAYCALPAKTEKRSWVKKPLPEVNLNISAYFFVLAYVNTYISTHFSISKGGLSSFHSVGFSLLIALIAPLIYWYSSNRQLAARFSLAICCSAAVIASILLFYTGAAESAKMQNAIGISYYRDRDYKESLEAYSRAISINPLNTTYATNRGWAFYYLGDKKRALEDANRALKISPKDKYALGLSRKLKS